MSLQHAAEAVRQQGRGEDTMLIHMTPDEVKGLQALAMAHGGSLTINPETGLPEASFLKSILPTLIGAGLAATGIGAPMAGLIVGGIQTARTGDLGQGILAGLGAYGGGSFAQAAAAAAPPTTAGMTPGAVATGLPGGAANVAGMAGQPAATNLSTMGSGLSNIFSSGATGEAARTAAMNQLGGSATGVALRGAAALAEPLTAVPEAPTVEPEEYNYDGPYEPTERKVRYPGPERDPMDTSEFQYFDTVNPVPGFQTVDSATPQTIDLSDEPTFADVPISLAANPDRMREYQANPDLYQFAKGGVANAPAAPINTPPANYRAGMEAEFDYGFQPMANVPATQGQGLGGLPGFKTQSLSDLQAAGGIGPGSGFAGTNITADQYRSGFINQFLKHPQIGPQLRAAGYYAEGGGLNMDDGGFVVDAHTVSEIGNGSSDAGHERLAKIGGEPIEGPGDGVSDSIKANIGGVQEARIARDESYLSRDDVKALGGGDIKKGEKMLYTLMRKAHESRKDKERGEATGLDKLIARMA